MSYKNLKGERKTSGFTIIEVLIVLAIAGLILLIVFLAVPALQRNARNTALKDDVQNVLGGVSEFAGANNGALPTNVASDGSGTINYTSTVTGSNATSIKVQASTEVTVIGSAPAAADLQPGQVRIVLKHKCNGNNAITSSNRAIAAFYLIETSSSTALQCVDS